MMQSHQRPIQPIDFAELRAQVRILQVLQLVQWQEVSRSGPQLRGPCPLHGSSSLRSRSFSVHVEKDVYHCFGCGAGGNQLDLAKALFGGSLYQAAVELCRKLGIEVPRSGDRGR